MAKSLAGKLPLAEIDFIVPIPLTKRKLQKRGFNQSELISNHLGALLNIPVAKNLLVKTKETPDTKKLSEENRLTVLSGAFAAYDTQGSLTGKTALIVDDVFTTGTTAEVSAATLKKAGCEKIYFASFTTRMARID
jgi:predicted amidophosphoribosyltransferase